MKNGWSNRVIVGAGGLAAALSAAAVAGAAPGDVELVSRASDGADASGASGAPSISADGCRIAFESTAPELSADDGNSRRDVYVRDLCEGETMLVSRADGGGSVGDAASSDPEISADGSSVVFVSAARNLDRLDPDSDHDVYRRDLDDEVTELVSYDAGHPNLKSIGGSAPSVSRDGRFVAFVADPGKYLEDEGYEPDGFGTYVLVRDIGDGSVSLASPDAGHSRAPSISDDGTKVAFTSDADELVDGDDNGETDVFVRTCASAGSCLHDGNTTLASRTSSAAIADGPSGQPEISADGSAVAFRSDAANLGGPGAYVRELAAGKTELVAAGGASPSISADGAFVAFASASGVSLSDRELGGTTFLADAREPSVNAAGDLIALTSELPLAPPDGDAAADVFRRERGERAPPPPPTPPVTGTVSELAPPVQGEIVNLSPTSGTVLVKLPGSKRFELISEATRIPVDSVVNVRRGTAELLAERADAYERASFWGGVFAVNQELGADAPMEAQLAGKLAGCETGEAKAGRAGGPLARSAAAAGGRSLWGSGSGKFRTRGRRGAGSVRGTVWLVADRCDGSTLVRVKEGTVEVNDFGVSGLVDKILTAGGRYVTKPKR